MPCTASTALPVDSCTARMWRAISSVALAVSTASDFTSAATTAKPRPASPARAASMVALSANRLVWPAMLRMSLTTSPIFSAACVRPAYSPFDALALSTAFATRAVVCASCELISAIEADSSSAEPATIETLSDASLDSRNATSACCVVSFDETISAPAVDFMASVLLDDHAEHLPRCARGTRRSRSRSAPCDFPAPASYRAGFQADGAR